MSRGVCWGLVVVWGLSSSGAAWAVDSQAGDPRPTPEDVGDVVEECVLIEAAWDTLDVAVAPAGTAVPADAIEPVHVPLPTAGWAGLAVLACMAMWRASHHRRTRPAPRHPT